MQEWKQTEVDINAIADEIEGISNDNARCRRPRQFPGFARWSPAHTVAAIGNGAAFRRGRDLAAWVGVVPRQYSTGSKQKLFVISKRGNIYLRRMLIHGARAVPAKSGVPVESKCAVAVAHQDRQIFVPHTRQV